jgi:hypothetical protein
MILFELIYPLKTHMEKRERLNELRKGKLPEGLLDRYRGISELILRMTNSDASKRPSAKCVLSIVEFEIDEISAEKSPKRNRFFSDDVKDRKIRDFEVVEWNHIVMNNPKYVLPTNLKTITDSYQLIESTIAFTLREMICEEENGQNYIFKEDSWEHVGNKIIDEKL